MQYILNQIKGENLSKIWDSIPLGISWIAMDGTIVAANMKFCKERGYTKDEIKKLHIRDINPLISTKGWRTYSKSVKDQGNRSIRSEHMTKDGKSFPVEIQSSFMDLEDGEYIYSCTIPVMEKERYKDLLEITSNSSKVVGWEWDTIHQSFTYSSYLLELLGMQEDHGFNQMLKTYLSKQFYADFKTALDESINIGKEFECDFHVRKDGDKDKKWLRISGQPYVVDDEILKVTGTIQDISRHRDFSDTLYLLKHYIDHSDEQVFWSNDKGKFEYANIKACQSLGYSARELKNMYVWDLIKMSKESWMNHWENLKKVGFIELENTQISREGKLIPVKTKKFALKYEDNYYNFAIVRDLTNDRKREAELQASLDKIRELQTKLFLENTYLKDEVLKEHRFKNIISKSDKYKKILSQIQDVAETDATVLILGESGTGKELLASAVHELSNRSYKTLVKVNCAALPANLIESELFGHEKGAYTGAFNQKIGRFELADEGTIFLDEIGELPLELQAKLLRVLQEGEFERLGSTTTLKVNTRIIAATNRDLVQLVKKGLFREDLFFRLNVFPITNLPLRERRDDIPLLAQFFLEKFAEKMNKEIEGISSSSMRRLTRYDYPGNVRELENIIERGVITNKGKLLKLPDSMFINQLADDDEPQGWLSLEEYQKDYITKALEYTNWKITGKESAAELLGLNGKTLYSKIKKLGIIKP